MLADISPEDLENPRSNAIKKLHQTITNLTTTQKGTKGWKLQGRKEATSLHRLCGPPAIFLTVSSPEFHCQTTTLYIQRRRYLLDHPNSDSCEYVSANSSNVTQLPFQKRRIYCSTHPSEVAAAFAARLDA
jgi:hypothetical protein